MILLVVPNEYSRHYNSDECFCISPYSMMSDVRGWRFDAVFFDASIPEEVKKQLLSDLAPVVRPPTETERLRERITALETQVAKLAAR